MAFDFSGLKSKYEEVMALVGGDLENIKTGRAKPAVVENVTAEAYGTKMPLKELASISAPDPNTIVVQPWDQSVVEAIEKALSVSGHNPVVDGQVVRVKIPALTGEKREEMVKAVRQQIESGKQMIRSERTDAKRQVEGQEGAGGVSEDEVKRDLEELDKVTHGFVEKLEGLGRSKEEELMTI